MPDPFPLAQSARIGLFYEAKLNLVKHGHLNAKEFLTRYKWAGPVIGFVLGTVFGTGGLWQFLDYRIKNNAASLEQTKLEKDYYERLQNIQNEVSSELTKYINLRDRHFANRQDYQTQIEYHVLTTKLAASIAQYNRLEVKLSELERRKVRWFVVPVPPVAPQKIRIETSPGGGPFIVADVVPDPLDAKVSEDVKAIIEEYGRQPPSSNETRSRNSP